MKKYIITDAEWTDHSLKMHWWHGRNCYGNRETGSFSIYDFIDKPHEIVDVQGLFIYLYFRNLDKTIEFLNLWVDKFAKPLFPNYQSIWNGLCLK